jgi:vacuolar-type H+-ATPase subunit F/Vma7
MENDITPKTRTSTQNKAMHKGFQQIADCLVENGKSLNVIIENLEVRPTEHNIKDVFRAIAKEKYGIVSTTELTTKQIDEVWEELVLSVGKVTGVFIPFPSYENTHEYLESYQDYETR